MSYIGYVIVKVQNNTDQDLTDFQVKFTLDNSNFTYWNTLKDNGIDLYFTLSDGQTLVPFWREFFDKENKQATFWIKVPAVTANSYTILYMHFGNPDETIDRSSSTQTFELFDSFNNLNDWAVLGDSGQGTATIENSKLKLTSPDVNNRISVCRSFSTDTSSGNGYMIGTIATGISINVGFTLSYGDGTGSTSSDIPDNSYTCECFRVGNTKHRISKNENSQLTELTTHDISATVNTEYFMEFGWYSDQLISRDHVNGVQLKTSDSTFNGFSHVHIGVANATWTFDYIYVRKYLTNSTDINNVDVSFESLTATVEDTVFDSGTINAVLVLNNVQQYIDTFTGDGSTTEYILSNSPVIPKVRVFINGIEIDETGYTVNYTNGTITLSAAPANNASIEIVYYNGEFNYVSGATVKASYAGTIWDTDTTGNRGQYTLDIPRNVEVQLRAETNEIDSITIVKLT